jgi:hypothetical protein
MLQGLETWSLTALLSFVLDSGLKKALKVHDFSQTIRTACGKEATMSQRVGRALEIPFTLLF